MGNRKQPFGYRVVMGEIALHPQESKLVEYIFQQYLVGATYNTLVEELRECSANSFKCCQNFFLFII